jgi:hypothetical protein
MKTEKGMAVTEYVILATSITLSLAGFYGLKLQNNKTAMEHMASAFEAYLGAITLSISLP